MQILAATIKSNYSNKLIKIEWRRRFKHIILSNSDKIGILWSPRPSKDYLRFVYKQSKEICLFILIIFKQNFQVE